MQHATSASSSLHGTASSAGERRLLQGLHSPGDTSPGIQFTRGSFSDHLLSLESPSAKPRQQSSQTQPVEQRPRSLHNTTASVKASATTKTTTTATTTSLLRSPTRKRPPPVPASAPKPPPTSIRSRATAAASSILMPPTPSPPRTTRAAPLSPSPSAAASPMPLGNKAERATMTRQETTTPSSSDTQAYDPLMVNPVDALAKKLRQQATELTQVYEQMEKKDAELNQLRGDVKQLTLQLDIQRTRQRSAMASRLPTSSSSSRSAGVVGKRSPPAPSSRVSGVVGGGVGSRKPIDVVPPPPSPTERQDQATEELAVTMRRMEESVAELRRVHQELLAQSETINASDIQHEQQLYIRVLEEAVHLKASELCVTGHEELLVVLAELRHTIYQQEHEIGELQKTLSTVQSEHLQCKSAKLEADDKTQRETSRLEQENHACKQREASLHRKLEELQRLAHTEHMRFRQERAAQEEQATRISTLEKELQSRTQELRQWETTRQESWTKKEAAMANHIQELQNGMENERVQASRAKEDLEKTQRQVDELKALQEGLLQSIDQFVTKEDAQEQQIKRLQTQVATTQQLNGENETLRSVSEELRKQITVLEQQATEQQCVNAKWEQVETMNRQIAEATETITEGEQNGDIKPLELWLQVLLTATESTARSWVPWLRVFVEDTRTTLSAKSHRVEELEKECDVLRDSNAQFEQTTVAATDERQQLQAQLLATQTKLIQTELEAEECKLQLTAINEELHDAQAQQHLREALATQIFQQENLLKTQQQRLELVLLQNAELMALETQLAAQLEQKERELTELQHALRQYKDQETLLHELESELEDAASLTEQQNAWNQQLTVELEHLELEKSDQDERVETMATRERVFVARFTALFTQYTQFVSVHRQRLMNEFAVSGQHGEKGGNQASPVVPATSVYDDALESHDVLQLIRVFPTLVEEYLANAMVVRGSEPRTRGNKLSRSRADQKDTVSAGNEGVAARIHSYDRSHAALVLRSPTRKKQPIAPADRIHLTPAMGTTRIDAIADDFKPLDEELREVAMAFSKFKSL